MCFWRQHLQGTVVNDGDGLNFVCGLLCSGFHHECCHLGKKKALHLEKLNLDLEPLYLCCHSSLI